MQLRSTAGRAAAQWHNCGPHKFSGSLVSYGEDCIVSNCCMHWGVCARLHVRMFG